MPRGNAHLAHASIAPLDMVRTAVVHDVGRMTDLNGPTEGASEPRLSLSFITTLLGVLGLVFLVVIAAYTAWSERRSLFRQKEDHARQEAYFLADHGQRLFEVSDLALRATATAASTRDWATIEQTTEVFESMHQVEVMLPYVDVVFLADETGLVRRSSLGAASAAASVADRDIFRTAASTPGDSLIIGEPIIARITRRPTFIMARRLEGPDGRFRGIVGVAMSLDYFTGYWARLDAAKEERVALVRGDGTVLVRSAVAQTAGSDERIAASVVAAAASGRIEGPLTPAADETGSLHRIGTLPVYIAVVYRNKIVEAQWRHRLLYLLPAFFSGMLALLFILLLGQRLARREAAVRSHINEARALLAASNARLEQRVAERTADLVESNEEIQRFAYIVSHDLRAPLVNIMGFTAEIALLRDALFARDGLPDPAVERDFDEAIGFIRSSISKMDGLIKAILTLSREGRRSFHPETIDMDALMRSILDGLAHQIQTTGATVVLTPLPALNSDRIAVEQIFSNLIDNAVKYLRSDVPGEIRISGRRAQDRIVIEVADNGRGIDMRDRERVFELFRRAGPQDRPGDGIGLAHVRALVRRLGGSLSLESSPGQGSVFTADLPHWP